MSSRWWQLTAMTQMQVIRQRAAFRALFCVEKKLHYRIHFCINVNLLDIRKRKCFTFTLIEKSLTLTAKLRLFNAAKLELSLSRSEMT